jgi:two-component system, OmpR family, response regulator
VRVLVVEDDEELRSILVRALAEAGYGVEQAADGTAGDELAAQGGFDVIILDWMLPGMSGLDVCRRARSAGDQAAILMLTARDELSDRILGLDAGADDYLIKPFYLEELFARLRSIVRRGTAQRDVTYSAGPITIDMRGFEARVNGQNVELTAREFGLLELLMRNANTVLTRDAIEERVWGAQFESSSNVVDVFIRRLRRKLGQAGSAIETVRGRGYRIRTEMRSFV